MLTLTASFQGGLPTTILAGERPVNLAFDINLGQDGQAAVKLAFQLVEDNENLQNKTVSAVVDWGDGQVDQFLPQNEVISQSLAHTYRQPGSYLVSVAGRNYAVEVSNVALAAIVSLVGQAQSAVADQGGSIFGPILPRDNGSPNKDQWQFNRGEDLAILESSVKMLLLTARGERVCEPDYGTSLRRAIFDSDPSTVVSTVTEDISSALARWEPRAVLQLASVRVTGSTATVDAAFLSRLSQQAFQLSLDFSR